MQVTNLRKNGTKLTLAQVESMAKQLNKRFKMVGFETEVHSCTTGGFKISSGGFSCFTINTRMLGYNARTLEQRTYSKVIANFKRTIVPTWGQRVEFNNILNSFLDRMECTARIKSGPFMIRDVSHGSYCEQDWHGVLPWSDSVYAVVELTPEMQREADYMRKEHRRNQSKAARERKKAQAAKSGLKLVVGGAK